MTTFLSLLPHAGGNVTPTLLVAGELVARGHRVSVLGHAALAEQVEAVGADFLGLTRAREWDPLAREPSTREMLSWLRLATDGGMAADLSDAIEREQPAALLLDCMVPGTLRSARRSGVPTAVFLHTLLPYWDAQWSVRQPMGLWLRIRGALPLDRRCLPDTFILGTDAQVDPPGRHAIPAARITQVGPVIPQTSAADPHADTLLVSLSTIGYPGQRELLSRLIRAVSGLGIRAVVTSGVIDQAMLPAVAGVEVLPYVDHSELLPSTRLLVGHGGHGSTMRALAAGVPVLVLPLNSHADHDLVGAAVRELGVGGVIDKRSGERAIRESIERALADAAMRERARELGQRLRASSGAALAADRLEQLARDAENRRELLPT